MPINEVHYACHISYNLTSVFVPQLICDVLSCWMWAVILTACKQPSGKLPLNIAMSCKQVGKAIIMVSTHQALQPLAQTAQNPGTGLLNPGYNILILEVRSLIKML